MKVSDDFWEMMDNVDEPPEVGYYDVNGKWRYIYEDEDRDDAVE